jgi:Lhr-like helicase
MCFAGLVIISRNDATAIVFTQRRSGAEFAVQNLLPLLVSVCCSEFPPE